MKKNTIGLFVIVFLIMMILCPCIVHLCSPYVNSEITADGILTYMSAAVTAICTIILSLIALAVSQKANDISDRMLKIEERRVMLEDRPFALITDWTVSEEMVYDIICNQNIIAYDIDACKEDEKVYVLKLVITNTTLSYETVAYFGGLSENYAIENKDQRKVYLAPGTSADILLYMHKQKLYSLIDNEQEIEFLLENRFSIRYKEKVEASVLNIIDQDEAGYRCNILFSKYQIKNVQDDSR